MPALDDILREANDLLVAHGLPVCKSIEPSHDPDSWNPVVFGYTSDARRRYAVKINVRHPQTLQKQLAIANAVRRASGLPIPVHYCCSQNGRGLALMIMEYMPGEQLRTALPRLESAVSALIVEDMGKCLARFHRTELFGEDRKLLEAPTDSRALVHGRMAWCVDRAAESSIKFAAHEDWVAVKDGTMSPSRLLAGRNWLLQQSEHLAETLDGYVTAARGEPVEVSLTKGDQDIREFLCQTSGAPRISGMLDWERVSYGDPRYEVMVLCHRLRLMELGHHWPDMRGGYEREAGSRMSASAAAMVYLLTRAMCSVVRGPRPDMSIEIIRDILTQEWTPFDEASPEP